MITTVKKWPCFVQKKQVQEIADDLTALCAIAEAVASERYEDLAGLVTMAKEFGASQWDVLEVLNVGIVEQRRREIERRAYHATAK